MKFSKIISVIDYSLFNGYATVLSLFNCPISTLNTYLECSERALSHTVDFNLQSFRNNIRFLCRLFTEAKLNNGFSGSEKGSTLRTVRPKGAELCARNLVLHVKVFTWNNLLFQHF